MSKTIFVCPYCDDKSCEDCKKHHIDNRPTEPTTDEIPNWLRFETDEAMITALVEEGAPLTESDCEQIANRLRTLQQENERLDIFLRSNQ